MDFEAVDNFWKLLEQQEFTSVVVTHDFNQIDAFLQSLDFKKDGRIAATKSVEDIHQAGQTIEQYFREEMNKGGEQAWKDSIKTSFTK